MSQALQQISGFAPLVNIEGEGKNVEPSFIAGGGFALSSPSGSLRITIGPPADDDDDDGFDENLAERMDDMKLGALGSQLVSDIQADDQSRAGWVQQYEEALLLLGNRMQQNRGDAGASTAPLEGMSTVVSPLLMGEVLKAQATARGELLPASGPVKVEDDSTASGAARDELADALQKDMNTYLTRVCTEYYPDTDRMLFYTVFCGSGFKKVYRCPIRRRPLSESVDAKDLIVNAGTTDLQNAHRITHVIPMRPSMLKRMQMVGAYRKVPVGAPMAQPSAINQTMADISGVDANPQQPHDQTHTIYEVLTELSIGDPRAPDDLPVPYKVTIDKDSMTILEIRRNWRPDDDLYRAREMYVRYPYIDAMSFYGLGLLHLLGNTAKALTAAIRMLLDAGMFSNFPGFLISSDGARQDTNEMRVAPGAGRKVNTGGRPIRDMVMELPYKEPSQVLLALVEALQGDAKALAGSAEIPTDDGKSPIPVGTMLAMIEQATKPTSAVHKRMHAAQAKEFQLLIDLLREDPEAFWRDGRRGVYEWDKETFIRALDSFEMVPVSDPNSPTRTHRLLKAQALKMMQQGNPALYDDKAVDGLILRLLGFSNPDEFWQKAPAVPPPNPALEMVKAKLQEGQAKIAQQAKSDELRMQEAQLKAKTDIATTQAKIGLDREKLMLDAKRLGAETAAEGMKGIRENHTALAMPDLELPTPNKEPTQ